MTDEFIRGVEHISRKCIRINGQLIPAFNIGVANRPGFIEDVDGITRWYPLYFELRFENGALWAVQQGHPEQSLWVVQQGLGPWSFHNIVIESDHKGVRETISVGDWAEFLVLYNDMVKAVKGI